MTDRRTTAHGAKPAHAGSGGPRSTSDGGSALGRVFTESARRTRYFAGLLRPYRARATLTAVAIVVATGAGLAPPYLAGLAIDRGIRTGDAGALTYIVLAFLIAGALYLAASWTQEYLVGWIGNRILNDLRTQAFAHLQTLSVGFYSRNRSGVLISRLTNDITALEQLFSTGIVALVSNCLTLVGVVAIMLALDWRLALVTFATFPILAFGSVLFRVVAGDAYRLTRERIAAVSAHLQETISGVRVVRAFAQEHRHEERFAELNEENRQANMRTVYLNASYYPSVELLSAFGTGAILLFGGYQAVKGSIAIGVVVAFTAYLQAFFDPIQQLSNLYTTWQQGVAALDKVGDLMETRPDLVEMPDAHVLRDIRGEIHMKDVSFAYTDEQWAVQGIDLSVSPGETVALVGETGAGKSTLGKLIARFYDPQRGTIFVDGFDLRTVTVESLRSRMGIVPQEGFLFSGTIGENIAFGRPNATADEIDSAIGAIGADEFIARLPSGLDTEIGERGVKLSAGERQMVAFARALIAEPKILILDEATSSVDISTETRIEKGLATLLSGRTAIVIAHRLSTIQGADRIVVMASGRIVEEGSHGALLDAGGMYSDLYREWVE